MSGFLWTFQMLHLSTAYWRTPLRICLTYALELLLDEGPFLPMP